MGHTYRFSFGPWNISEGADAFGPAVRRPMEMEKKLRHYKELGFDGVQFHDDDVVPEIEELTAAQTVEKARALHKILDDSGLVAEFVAPRLWEHPLTVDGAFTSNDPAAREFAAERCRRSVAIANELGCDLIVLWLAREGTYIREAKDSRRAIDQIVAATNRLLEADSGIRVAIEPKPNEPMDQAYVPTVGHAIGLAALTVDADRVGALIESAHAILAGLDPSDEMGYALAHTKLFSVHLNDQNGLKYDQDKVFGSVDLRRAFNQVRVLDAHGYGNDGAWVGLDVKAMRTQRDEVATKHLRNSREVFLSLLDLSRSLDASRVADLVNKRDYEELDLFIMKHLMGRQ